MKHLCSWMFGPAKDNHLDEAEAAVIREAIADRQLIESLPSQGDIAGSYRRRRDPSVIHVDMGNFA